MEQMEHFELLLIPLQREESEKLSRCTLRLHPIRFNVNVTPALSLPMLDDTSRSPFVLLLLSPFFVYNGI